MSAPGFARELPLTGTAPSRLLYRLGRTALLTTVDAMAISLSVGVAFALWAAPVRSQSAAMYLQLLPLVTLFIAGYARAGLYPGLGLGPVETLRRLSYVTTFGFLILAAFSFALKLPHLYSRATFLLAFGLSLACVPLGRIVLFHLAGRWQWWTEPVVVIGTGRRAVRAIRGIAQSSHLGYRAAAVLTPDTPADCAGTLESVPIAGGLDRAPALAASGIRVAFLEIDQMQTRAALDQLQRHFQHVILLREFDDLPVEGLQVRNLGNLIGIEYTNNLLRPGNQVVKRALDLLVAGVLLVAAVPIIVLAALLVILIDGGPVFFHQDRAGLAGRRIRVPKIRTMRRDADRRLEEYLTANPALREEWTGRFKLRNDPRLIPGIGRLFRRFSIDELPQLWAVIAGDMSLVGPRPFPDYHLDRFSPSFLELRHRVRPGITGVWQVTVRSDGGVEDQEALDSYYIRNWSVWFDLYILGKTIAVVASGRGAY